MMICLHRRQAVAKRRKISRVCLRVPGLVKHRAQANGSSEAVPALCRLSLKTWTAYTNVKIYWVGVPTSEGDERES
jgi:hypothetical protein